MTDVAEVIATRAEAPSSKGLTRDEAVTGVVPRDGSSAAERGANGRSHLRQVGRVAFVAVAAALVWELATRWDRWAGATRFETTDDAYLSGDLTPLSAKVSGHVVALHVRDFAVVKRGEVLAEIEPLDYEARAAEATANRAAAEAALDSNAEQKAIQRALVRQAAASIEAAKADVVRSHLEANRQRALLEGHLAGTAQAVEQAVANESRFAAQLELTHAALDQQKALLSSLDVRDRQLAAQIEASAAQVRLAENDRRYTRIRSPVDGMAGQIQVHPGQFVAVGTQILAVMPLPKVWVIANFKETQMTKVRVGQRARVTVDAFPDLQLEGRVDGWSPGTGSTFALLAPDNATGNFTKVVQRLPVKIVLDAAPYLGVLVRPGMSVVTTIDTAGGAPGGVGSTPGDGVEADKP